jgi:hypothetical protein
MIERKSTPEFQALVEVSSMLNYTNELLNNTKINQEKPIFQYFQDVDCSFIYNQFKVRFVKDQVKN